jgi:hypothetical protein
MRDASTLAATTTQLASGLSIAAATIALRFGGPLGRLLPSTPTGKTAYTVAFLLLALIAIAATVLALLLHSQAGDVGPKQGCG